MTAAEVLERCALRMKKVVIRTCRADDLAELEWFGTFTPHRQLIRDAYARQERGEVAMLVADVNGFPAGQVWVDFVRRGAESAGTIWALRVLPMLQGKRMGTRLLATAEAAIHARGLAAAEIGAEKHNAGARRLYERRGYRVVREVYEWYEYTTPNGVWMRLPVDLWILRKPLDGANDRRERSEWRTDGTWESAGRSARSRPKGSRRYDWRSGVGIECSVPTRRTPSV